MKTLVAILVLAALCGCSSGRLYQAPDLCAALVECQKGGEKSCSYSMYVGYDYGVKCKQVETGAKN